MDRFKKNRILLILFLCVLVALYNMAQLIAAPVKDRVIESVDVVDDIHRSEVSINFSFPVRYLKHFPLHKGKELRIRLRPLVVPQVDLDAVFERESMVPHHTELAPLYEVVYEGDFTPEGFYVYLTFNNEMAFGVEQGSNFRSIIVYVCKHEYSNKLKRCLD